MKHEIISACTGKIPEVGYVAVLYHEGENPSDIVRQFMNGEKVSVYGPYVTEEEAKVAGEAVLNKVVEKENSKGNIAMRYTGKT